MIANSVIWNSRGNPSGRGMMLANDLQDLVLAELRAQTGWLRLLGLQAFRPLLERTLRTEKHKAVFEYSNGRRSVREVARLTGVGAATVSRLWTEWLAVGICTEARSTPGRAEHLVPLSVLGVTLAVPSLAPGDTDQGEDNDEHR